jgi:hypothetical protein
MHTHTMVGLLSLSIELLMNVFTSCTTIQSAASLSCVDKTLNSVWRKYNNHIATSILRQQIPEYKDAVNLAILEELWLNGNSQLASKPFTKLPVRLYGKQLLKIAKLATSASAARVAYDKHVQIFPPNQISLHAAYYLMRKIALAYLHPEAQLQDALCQALRSYSKEDLNRIDRFCEFLCGPLSEWTPPEDEDEWDEGGEQRDFGYVVGEPWQYVDRVIQAALEESLRGKGWLERVIGNSRQ